MKWMQNAQAHAQAFGPQIIHVTVSISMSTSNENALNVYEIALCHQKNVRYLVTLGSYMWHTVQSAYGRNVPCWKSVWYAFHGATTRSLSHTPPRNFQSYFKYYLGMLRPKAHHWFQNWNLSTFDVPRHIWINSRLDSPISYDSVCSFGFFL